MKTKLAVLIALSVSCAYAQKDAKDIYLDKCAVCHGADGSASTAKGRKLKMKGVKDVAAKMTAEQMIKITTEGKGVDMDAFGKEFKPEQIKALVEFYRGLAK